MLRLHCDRKAARAIHIKPRAPHPIERPPIFRPKATRRRIGTNCASQEQSGEIPLLCNHCGTLSKSVAFNGRTNGDTRGRHRRSRGSRADEKLEGLTMQSCRLDFGYIQSAVGSRILPTILFTVAVCCAVPGTTHAAPLAPHQSAFRFQDDLTQVRATVHRGRAVVGPRGGAVVRRGTARGRTARQRCGASNDSGPAWLSRRRRALGTARLVSLAGRRRDRRRRSDRFRDSRDCSGVGGCRTRARNVLVLYRSLTHPGLLGLLPVTAKRMGRHHVAGRDRSSSSG
ncbi:hypothetical protein ACVIHB_003472 [Bradyrhizobium liaoningense]